MGEKQKIIKREISYEGLFDYKEFFRRMDFWLRDKFYDKWEKRSEEYVAPDGTKTMEFEFTPWKKTTHYHKIVIKIELWISGLKEVEIDVDGEKKRMNEGKMRIAFTGYLVVDYENKWEKSPLLYFIRDLYDKFIYSYITKKYYNMAVDDVNDLINTLNTYLNTFKAR